MTSQDYAAVRKVWAGQEFDSQLEADWACTLESLGIKWVYHPGRIELSEPGMLGQWWEPDFLLLDPMGNTQHDVLLEVKGPHDDRIWKAQSVARTTGRDVLIGRPGFVPPLSGVESAGLVFHGTRLHGPEWVLEQLWRPHSGVEWSRFTTEPRSDTLVRLSAERTLVRPDASGAGMRKAV